MNEVNINARITALASQRDDALNRFVNLCGVLAERDARIAELEAQIANLTADTPSQPEELTDA